MGKTNQTVLKSAGREVVITNPDKMFFPQAGHTKCDLARYYLAASASLESIGSIGGAIGKPLALRCVFM